MPEIVRQHTHVHKVYKLIDAPPPVHGVLPSKWPAAQPHISLLGYTTTASGAGPLMPDLTQLIGTPTLTPNYGPALFDNKYLSESQPKKELQELEEKQEEGKAGKIFQQLFKPNIMDAMDTTEEQPAQMEHNELLNTNFLAALQSEYMAKFGSKSPKIKRQKPKSFFRLAAKPLKPKSQTKSKTKTKFREQESEEYATNYLQDFEEQEEAEKEAEELPDHTNYAEHLAPHSSSNPFYEPDDDTDYDSASAFSSLNNNGLSFLPTPDEFLNHIHGPNSYTGNTYADLYDDHDDNDNDDDDYGPTPTGTAWKTVPSNGSNKLRHRQRRRPALDMITDGMGWATPSAIGSTSSSSPSTASGHSSSNNNNSHHMRFPKLINRRKRKNRFKSKIYRI